MTIRGGDFGLKPDPDFAADERLYRRVKPDQISEENHVLALALDDITERHPSCSFNRSKYSDPEDVLDSNHPAYNRIAFLVAGNLPEPQSHPSNPTMMYAFRLTHLPDRDNHSHTEAQVTKQVEIASLPEDATKLGSPALRRQLREALAEKMFVLAPTA